MTSLQNYMTQATKTHTLWDAIFRLSSCFACFAVSVRVYLGSGGESLESATTASVLSPHPTSQASFQILGQSLLLQEVRSRRMLELWLDSHIGRGHSCHTSAVCGALFDPQKHTSCLITSFLHIRRWACQSCNLTCMISLQIMQACGTGNNFHLPSVVHFAINLQMLEKPFRASRRRICSKSYLHDW